MKLKVKLAKLSVCPCGEGLLSDDIKLGAVFTVHAETANALLPWSLICGKCGRFVSGRGTILADCYTDPSAPPGLIPLELFNFPNA